MTLHTHQAKAYVPVWDPLVRIFHWSLVLLFLTAYLSGDDWMTVHSYSGYGIAMLITFRLVWGVIGTRYARFSNFVTGPEKIRSYLRSLLSRHPQHFTGHNPAGGAMVILLLVMLSLICLSGMILIAGEGQGPLAEYTLAVALSDWMEDPHELFVNLTVVLIVCHVAGVLISSLLHRENLIKAMVTGKKTLPESQEEPQASQPGER